MEKHYGLSDTEFEQKINNCQLNPTIFSHEAHLRLAWIHIRQYGLEQAEKNIQEQLQKFVANVGATDKYHITLTVAAIRIVANFMNQSKANSFKDFIIEFPELKNNFKALIKSHYSFDILNSAQAKKEFVMPDILAF